MKKIKYKLRFTEITRTNYKRLDAEDKVIK